MTMEWQRKNRERYLEYLHGWCDRNRARTRMNSRIYYWKHRDEILGRSADKRRARTFFQSLEMLASISKAEIPDAPPPEIEAEMRERKEKKREYWRRRWAAIKADPEQHERIKAMKRAYKHRKKNELNHHNQEGESNHVTA